MPTKASVDSVLLCVWFWCLIPTILKAGHITLLCGEYRAAQKPMPHTANMNDQGKNNEKKKCSGTVGNSSETLPRMRGHKSGQCEQLSCSFFYFKMGKGMWVRKKNPSSFSIFQPPNLSAVCIAFSVAFCNTNLVFWVWGCFSVFSRRDSGKGRGPNYVEKIRLSCFLI